MSLIRKVRLEPRYGGLIPPSESENAVVWTLLGMLKNTMTLLPYHFAEDIDLVRRLTTTVTLVKFSTLGTDHFSLNSTSVLSQFLQASKDVATYPTMQATLEGAQQLDNHTKNRTNYNLQLRRQRGGSTNNRKGSTCVCVCIHIYNHHVLRQQGR